MDRHIYPRLLFWNNSTLWGKFYYQDVADNFVELQPKSESHLPVAVAAFSDKSGEISRNARIFSQCKYMLKTGKV